MIEYMLPCIRDAGDYLTALALFRAGSPLTSEEVEKLVEIYQKYSREAEDPALTRLCLALDLLPGRARENGADFAALELLEDDLEALFLTKELTTGKAELTGEIASAVVAAVSGGLLTRPLDILLARTALDMMPGSFDFGGFREQAASLAAFLTGLGPEVMEKYTVFMEEAQRKCRQ